MLYVWRGYGFRSCVAFSGPFILVAKWSPIPPLGPRLWILLLQGLGVRALIFLDSPTGEVVTFPEKVKCSAISWTNQGRSPTEWDYKAVSCKKIHYRIFDDYLTTLQLRKSR